MEDAGEPKKATVMLKTRCAGCAFCGAQGKQYLGHRMVGRHTGIIPLEHLLQSRYICMLRQCAQ